MNESTKNFNSISTQLDLKNLIDEIKNGLLIAEKFKFKKRTYFIDLLEALNIDYEEFSNKYYYYDSSRKLHISESEFKYIWISTYGLIAKDKVSNNKAVNACVNQCTAIELILDKAIEVSKSDNVYDIDSYNFGLLNELSPALFHNLIFYIEVFCKAYLSLSGIDYPNTHKLSIVYTKLIDTMYAKKNNDSLFQIQIVDKFATIIEHVTNIPGNFKEQFVKYDDNPEDSTVIIFEPQHLHELKIMIDLCNDFILDYYYTGDETHYLKSGFYKRLLEKAENDEEKKKIIKFYSHLINKDV